MKPNLFHTQFFRLFFLILLAGISIQTYAAKDSQAAPKKRTITGTVISEGDNMPIIGANVWLKNSSTGAITDLDGKYSITIDNSVVGGVLVFSYIGMSTQEVAIGNQNVINSGNRTDDTGFFLMTVTYDYHFVDFFSIKL